MTTWEVPNEDEFRAASEREQLRHALSFPDAVEVSTDAQRLAAVEDLRGGLPDERDPVMARIDQLSRRVEALAAMVETLLDRLEHTPANGSALTADEMA